MREVWDAAAKSHRHAQVTIEVRHYDFLFLSAFFGLCILILAVSKNTELQEL
jgi:hypothetical protein